MIKREIQFRIRENVDYKKAIILLGPRQVGKTTLVEWIIKDLNKVTLRINGDNPAHRIQWANPSWEIIKQLIAPYNIIFIDEAQRIENIGLTAKMIIDGKTNKQLIITGSSSFSITKSINEPLTGRKWEYRLFPLSWGELKNHYTLALTMDQLENYLIYGMYPDVITNENNKIEILRNLAGSYLYKDVVELSDIRKPDVILRLLQALAWQVGNEVSYNELAQTIHANKDTVMRYIHLLESAYVIFKLEPLSRNPRNEITSSRKFYFYDNGIRNAIIDNFSPIVSRQDIGALWENFVIAERKKSLEYHQVPGKVYFWRSKAGAEIDYIEESNGIIKAYEVKWNENAKVRFPDSFIEKYKPIEMKVVNKMNYWEMIDQ